jgi:hypothetical protein
MPCHWSWWSTRGTEIPSSPARSSQVSEALSARTRSPVRALKPILTKPADSPVVVCNWSTGLRLARAGPRRMLTLMSGERTDRR